MIYSLYLASYFPFNVTPLLHKQPYFNNWITVLSSFCQNGVFNSIPSSFLLGLKLGCLLPFEDLDAICHLLRKNRFLKQDCMHVSCPLVQASQVVTVHCDWHSCHEVKHSLSQTPLALVFSISEPKRLKSTRRIEAQFIWNKKIAKVVMTKCPSILA